MPQAFRESDDQAFCYLNHCFVKMTSIKQKNIHLDNHIDQLHVNYKVNIITPFYVKMPEAKTVHVTESTYCICIFREFFIFREKWVHFSRFSRKISNTKNVQHYPRPPQASSSPSGLFSTPPQIPTSTPPQATHLTLHPLWSRWALCT